MRKDYLLNSELALELYEDVKNLPIIDYHCHLVPQEIYEDKVFDNIGEMWLAADHYKWRLMRQAGVDEYFITGKAPWREKFKKYAETISLCGGNPLYSWSMMELSLYFGIDIPLNGYTADEIYDLAGNYIAENKLSPRKLIEKAGVEYIATTDDPADYLEYHKEIAKDESFKTKVVPAFRPDNLLNIDKKGYADYIKKLGNRIGLHIDDIGDLRIAIRLALDDFVSLGCNFADHGIEDFPSRIYPREEAEKVFIKALIGNDITKEEKDIFIGYLTNFLAGEYKRRNITMQLHIAVKRDANSLLTKTCGKDTGSDCIGDIIDGTRIMKVLDTLNNKGKLPKTIIYNLNPVMNAQLAAICGSFRNVVPGAAWWFCDHKRGIINMMETMAEEGYIGAFYGMLTDSRSFLSYARHDYFRRILCSLIAKWVTEDDFPMESAKKLAYKISYGNIKERVSELNPISGGAEIQY
ncbi:MAG: glucuronate isomerase [Clostridia bacterium]|nr:glucuronate isomerase [Clostridia bacterium]